jgi:hypothetical protein
LLHRRAQVAYDRQAVSMSAGIKPWRELTLRGGIPRFRERGDWSNENMSKHSYRSRGFRISRGANT